MEILEHYKVYLRPPVHTIGNVPGLGVGKNCSWFFELEPSRFSLVTDVHDSDIIPVYSHDFLEDQEEKFLEIMKEKIILGLGVFHTDDDYLLYTQPFANSWKNFTEKFFTVETNLLDPQVELYHVSRKKIINYDLLWNRHKLYFTEYNRLDLRYRLWTYESSEKMFRLDSIEKSNSAKRFLSPNRIEFQRQSLDDKKRQYYRHRLTDVIKTTDNIFSDWTSTPIKLLPSEENIINDRGTFRVPTDMVGRALWLPLSNSIYSDTFISVYVETIVNSTYTKVITEKTFDPLIKGNFILPFGYAGMVQDIKSYGFKLPSWINYEYDGEVDVDIRFDLFIKEFNRLQKIDIKHFYQFFKEDYDILVHNRNIFFTKEYDTLYPSLIKALQNV